MPVVYCGLNRCDYNIFAYTLVADWYILEHFAVSKHNNVQDLVMKYSLDREKRENMMFDIRCKVYSKNQQLGSFHQPILIHVSDVNDNPPIFSKTKNQMFEINNISVSIGTIITVYTE